MQEARELAKESTYEYDAHPLEVINKKKIAIDMLLIAFHYYRIIYLNGTLLFEDQKIRTLKKEGEYT